MMDSSDATNKTNKRIKAVRFDVPGQTEVSADTDQPSVHNSSVSNPARSVLLKTDAAPWWHSQFNLMLLVFGLLTLTAILFVLLIPSPSVQQSQSAINQSPTSAALSAESPWNESRRAQARTDAQLILSNLLDGKKDLENKQVEIWAPVKFQQALEYADDGDNFYKSQDYAQALTSYQSSVDKLDELYELIPNFVKSKISTGLQALQQGKSTLAQEAFEMALKLEPNNLSATSGLGRAKTLDQVLNLSQAAAMEQQLFVEQDELDFLLSAQQKLDEAIALDGQNTELETQLATVLDSIQDKQYRDAMSKGFAALFVNSYASANGAFASALKYKQNDVTASLAYQQSLASNKTASLQSLLNQASAYEASENWQSALSNYQAVLQRDPNQINAKLGQIRSRARNQLDSQLRDVLRDPLLLSKTNQNKQAKQLLTEGKAIKSAGPKLKSQLEQLDAALKSVEMPVKVRLVSDAMTEITLSKEGASQIKLGRFTNKNLSLRPGRYVLSGVRSGFRDVRKQIEISLGSKELPSIELSCDQPISAMLQGAANDST